MAMIRSLLVVLVLVCVSLATVPMKNLAGEPSEFGSNLLPLPQQNAQTQNSAAYLIQLKPSKNKKILTAETTIVVDSDTMFSFSFYSPHDEVLTLNLVDPNGKKIDLTTVAQPGNFPIGDYSVDGTTYAFNHPVTGTYKLTMTSQEMSSKKQEKILKSTYADAYIIVFNENAVQEHTYLNTYKLTTGSKIGVITRAFNESISKQEMMLGRVPTPMLEVQSAEMVVTFPDGSQVEEKMKDDGLHSEGEARDGVFGAMITAKVPGDYMIQAVVRGVAPNGASFLRTTEQVFTVIDQMVTMSSEYAVATIDNGSNRMIVNFVLSPNSVLTKYRAYAEVWGKDATGNDVAVCWIGGMSIATKSEDGVYLPLELDLNWVSRVGAVEPFTLKNVVVQQPDTSIPLVQVASIALKTTFDVSKVMSTLSLLKSTSSEITEEMRMGRRPLSLQEFNATTGSLILAHGYCSDVNPFSAVEHQFTNGMFFLNPSVSLSNDQFALKVVEFASQTPFSFVGHSQGGMVGLHLFNYYWTGIDTVSGGRLIQTVGTPYQGCGAAGAAANLGKIFGVGCGTNPDLTKDGAALWLPGIAQNTRSKAYYWTTTYKLGNWFGDNCNFAMNLVLSWPNDGVAEFDYSQLSGGNNMGNKEQWCHSVGMKYTAQTQDPTRNAEMNTNAARKV